MQNISIENILAAIKCSLLLNKKDNLPTQLGIPGVDQSPLC